MSTIIEVQKPASLNLGEEGIAYGLFVAESMKEILQRRSGRMGRVHISLEPITSLKPKKVCINFFGANGVCVTLECNFSDYPLIKLRLIENGMASGRSGRATVDLTVPDRIGLLEAERLLCNSQVLQSSPPYSAWDWQPPQSPEADVPD